MTGLQLLGSLDWFWYYFGYFSEGRGWLDGALAHARELQVTLPAAAHAKALSAVGLVAWLQGDFAAARALLEESVTLASGLGPAGRWNLADTLRVLGLVVRDLGDPAGALSPMEESVAIFRELGDRWTLALALVSLGRTVTAAGDLAVARSLLEEGGLIFCDMRDIWGHGLAQSNLALAALREDDYGRAARLYREGVALFWEVEHRIFTIRCLEEMAWLASLQSDDGRAVRLFGVAEAQREALGLTLPAADAVEHEQHVSGARSRLDERAFAAGWAEGRAMTLEQAVAYALEQTNA